MSTAEVKPTEDLATSFREHYELATGQCLNWTCVYEALKATLTEHGSEAVAKEIYRLVSDPTNGTEILISETTLRDWHDTLRPEWQA